MSAEIAAAVRVEVDGSRVRVLDPVGVEPSLVAVCRSRAEAQRVARALQLLAAVEVLEDTAPVAVSITRTPLGSGVIVDLPRLVARALRRLDRLAGVVHAAIERPALVVIGGGLGWVACCAYLGHRDWWLR